MKTDEKISYAKAMAEIEEIVRSMNENQLDVDKLGEQVERASMLIKMCRERLAKAQQQVEKAVEP